MSKPTFAPIYVPPGFYFEIQDVSNASGPTGPIIGAIIGQGAKTANRIQQITKGVKNGQDGPLDQNVVIDVVSIVDQNNITYTKGVDFKITRTGATAKIDWSLLASLVGSVDLTAVSPDLTVLNGLFFNINIDGTNFSVQFSGFTNATTAADVVAFINSWDPGLSGSASLTSAKFLTLSANSITINEGGANSVLGFSTGQFANVGEPATGLIYNVFYTSDKTSDEYKPVLTSSMNQIVGLYGALRAATTLVTGTPTAAGAGPFSGAGSLSDTTKTWTVDQFVGNYVKITAGPGKGQVRVIYGNSTNQLLLSQNWTSGNVPDGTSTYVITDINNNTVVLGGKCFTDAIGQSSFLIVSQTYDDLFDDLNEKKAIVALEQPISGVNPMCEVLMRGLTTSDANSILSYCKAHVRRMSDRLHTKVRDMFFGLAQGNNNFLTYTQLATGTLERRITIVSPSQVPKDFGQGLVQLDGSYVAAALMGIYCNPLVDAGEPILLKSMGQVFDVDNFSDPFLDIEKNQMATAGITIIERQGTDLVVRDDLTTDQTTDFSGGLKFQRASDFIAKYVQTNLVNVLTGKRFTKAIRGVAQTQFILLLQALQEGQNPFPIITENGLEDISVTQNSTNHQQLDFKATITLIGDVKWEFALLGFKV